MREVCQSFWKEYHKLRREIQEQREIQELFEGGRSRYVVVFQVGSTLIKVVVIQCLQRWKGRRGRSWDQLLATWKRVTRAKLCAYWWNFKVSIFACFHLLSSHSKELSAVTSLFLSPYAYALPLFDSLVAQPCDGNARDSSTRSYGNRQCNITAHRCCG